MRRRAVEVSGIATVSFAAYHPPDAPPPPKEPPPPRELRELPLELELDLDERERDELERLLDFLPEPVLPEYFCGIGFVGSTIS